MASVQIMIVKKQKAAVQVPLLLHKKKKRDFLLWMQTLSIMQHNLRFGPTL